MESLKSFLRIGWLLLVPPRVRKRIRLAASHDDLHRWSLALGVAMIFVGAMVAYVDFVSFAWALADREATLFWEKAQGGQITQTQEIEDYLHSGVLVWASFLFRPKTWLESWILFEGIFRAAIALGTRHAIGTWPAYPIAVAWDELAFRVRRRSRLSRLGPFVPDRVVRNPRAGERWAIRIESSRDKGWNAAETLDVEGSFFELVSVEDFEEGGRLRVRHLLRPWPTDRIVRRLVRYGPSVGGSEAGGSVPEGAGTKGTSAPDGRA